MALKFFSFQESSVSVPPERLRSNLDAMLEIFGSA